MKLLSPKTEFSFCADESVLQLKIDGIAKVVKNRCPNNGDKIPGDQAKNQA